MMAETNLTVEAASESITGFDEIAIAQHFGHTVTDLATSDPSMLVRALVFVVKRRDGASDDEARNVALGLTMKECAGFFAEAVEDEAGKEQELVERPESSLTSVS